MDVPCSTDRHAVSEGDNFIFLPANNEKLERLPTLQIEILANCIRMLKPGGSLVYSTCSLSPKQNDDVVETALWRAFSTHSITANVMYAIVINSCHSLFVKLIISFAIFFQGLNKSLRAVPVHVQVLHGY